MRKMIKFCFSFMITIFALILVQAEAYAESITSGKIVDRYKVWTINFNSNVQFDNLTKNYITVVDSKGVPVQVTLELLSDKKSIKVRPNFSGYTPGETYTLRIKKGLKNEKIKELKNDVIMDFNIKSDEDSTVNYSINNTRNGSLIVQDEDFIYYSNPGRNGYIYKMNKDGSKKELLYRGTGSASNLKLVDDYIYFTEDDPYVEEDASRICKIKTDGTGRVQVLYTNVSNASYMQIQGNNLYYSTIFELYKGDINGGASKRIIDKIENASDEIFFTVKDGWIYCWGTNYITGKRTGIYRMKSDGSEKQLIIKNYSTEYLSVDNVNIDNERLYYVDNEGWMYTVNLNGSDFHKISLLGEISNTNVFEGYIYYSAEENLYKVKADGTDTTILANDLNMNYPYINIVDGQVWYYNSYEEISKVALQDGEAPRETNPSVLKPEGTITLGVGKTFYVKGVNNSYSKIIKYTSYDMNNDGIRENIILTGDYKDFSYSNLKLFVYSSFYNKVISYDSLTNVTCEEEGNLISLGDYNNDKINDIKIDLLTNMQIGAHSTYIYTLSNNKLNKLFDEGMIPKQGEDFQYELLINANIKVSDGKNGYYLVDLSRDDDEHYNYIRDIGLGVGRTLFYEGKDLDSDGTLELHITSNILGVSYSDILCSVETVYKYNLSTEKWEYKDFIVESEFYPCEGFKKSNSDGQVDEEDSTSEEGENIESSTIVMDNSPVQHLQEDEYYVYYVKDYLLYKVSKNLSVSTIIAQNVNPNIQLYDGWIYYVSRYGVNFHRVKVDGTSDEVLLNSITNSFSIVGDWIYFSDYTQGVYKMEKDGSEILKLSPKGAAEIAVAGEWVYYIDSKDWKLYRSKIDGTLTTALNEAATHGLGSNKDSIYYFVRHSANSSLYKMNVDGTGKKSITDEAIGKYAVYNGYAYYVNILDSSIHKIKTDKTGLYKVGGDKVLSIIGVAQDYIYYTAYDETYNERIYRISVEGEEVQTVN